MPEHLVGELPQPVTSVFDDLVPMVGVPDPSQVKPMLKSRRVAHRSDDPGAAGVVPVYQMAVPWAVRWPPQGKSGNRTKTGSRIVRSGVGAGTEIKKLSVLAGGLLPG
jgi:hypothetical protein